MASSTFHVIAFHCNDSGMSLTAMTLAFDCYGAMQSNAITWNALQAIKCQAEKVKMCNMIKIIPGNHIK